MLTKKKLVSSIALAGLIVLGAAGVTAHYYGLGNVVLLKRKVVTKVRDKAEEHGYGHLLKPGERYPDHVFKGQLRTGHPRILFSAPNAYDRLRFRYSSDERYRRVVDAQVKGKGTMAGAVAWACRNDRQAGRQGIEALIRQHIPQPENNGGNAGQALNAALAFDLLGNHPDLDTGTREALSRKLGKFVNQGLMVLNADSASMWHGRFELACTVWVAAVAMDSRSEGLQARAQAHFFEALKAIHLTEGWPEGYNYWINNRAFAFAAACAAHVNGVHAPEVNARIRGLVERVGLWTIYGTEPIGRFVLFGDTGPRNDLKDETQRVVDLLGLLTKNPMFWNYSRYISGLHGGGGYYPPYRWGMPLFRGYEELDFTPGQALDDLSLFEGTLPKSALFGQDALGHVFIRSGWGPDSTFIFFQAGDSLTHHGHYKAGHFSITKKSPLAINSGTYGDYFGQHRLNYTVRTVASNSILVLRPGEEVRPNRFFKDNVAGGGQRVVMPTGSAIVSVEDWKRFLNSGPHYQGGRIRTFDNSDPRFVFLASDLTPAYNNAAFDTNRNGGKVSEVTRQLVYLQEEDLLIVYDFVAATDESYTKKWLLHSMGRPETENEQLLVGTRDNGILQSTDAKASIKYKRGALDILRILPQNGVMRKIGGPDYRFYVEADGDDSDLDGRNMDQGVRDEPWYDSGKWRLEIQAQHTQKKDRFLVVLRPRMAERQLDPIQARVLSAKGGQAVASKKAVVFFRDFGAEKVEYRMPDGNQSLHILTGLPGSLGVEVDFGDGPKTMQTSPKGVLVLEVPEEVSKGKVKVDLVW